MQSRRCLTTALSSHTTSNDGSGCSTRGGIEIAGHGRGADHHFGVCGRQLELLQQVAFFVEWADLASPDVQAVLTLTIKK